MDCRHGPFDEWDPRRGRRVPRVASNDADEAGGPYRLDLWGLAATLLRRLGAACDVRSTRRVRGGRPRRAILAAAAGRAAERPVPGQEPGMALASDPVVTFLVTSRAHSGPFQPTTDA